MIGIYPNILHPKYRVYLQPTVVCQHMEKQVQFRANGDALIKLPPKLWVTKKSEFLGPSDMGCHWAFLIKE